MTISQALLSKDTTVCDLLDSAISDTLKNKYDIDMPAEYAYEYFYKYATENLPHLFD
jgi:hypothetical protein